MIRIRLIIKALLNSIIYYCHKKDIFQWYNLYKNNITTFFMNPSLDGELQRLDEEKLWLLSQVPESEQWFVRFTWNRFYEDFRVCPEDHIEGYKLANQKLREEIDKYKKRMSEIIFL